MSSPRHRKFKELKYPSFSPQELEDRAKKKPVYCRKCRTKKKKYKMVVTALGTRKWGFRCPNPSCLHEFCPDPSKNFKNV